MIKYLNNIQMASVADAIRLKAEALQGWLFFADRIVEATV